MNHPCPITVGFDWASRRHQVCLVTPERPQGLQRSFPNTGVGLHAFTAWVLELSGRPASEVGIAIERPEGLVVEHLLDAGFRVHAINPRQADRFRDRWSPSGAKDDRRDARVLASALRPDTGCFRCLAPLHPCQLALRTHARELTRLRRKLASLGQELPDKLGRYFPELLAQRGHSPVTAPWFLALLQRVPTPERARRVRASTLDRLLKQHHVRRLDGAGLKQALSAQRARVSPATVAAAVCQIELLLPQLVPLQKAIVRLSAECDRLSQQLLAETEAPRRGGAGPAPPTPARRQPSSLAEVLRSMPGVGPMVTATLLGEARQPLLAGNHRRLRVLAGVAPVTRASGRSRKVHRRRAANQQMRNALFHWARAAVNHDRPSQVYYRRRRAAGDGHGTALRKLGDRLLRVLAAMIRNRTRYHQSRWPVAPFPRPSCRKST